MLPLLQSICCIVDESEQTQITHHLEKLSKFHCAVKLLLLFASLIHCLMGYGELVLSERPVMTK